jgi:hypothetical protein
MTRGDTAARLAAADEAAREERFDRFMVRFLAVCVSGFVLLALLLVVRAVILAWSVAP